MAAFSHLALGASTRVSFVLIPSNRGTLREQVIETLATMAAVLGKASRPMVVTSQTVFLRELESRQECECIFAEHYGTQAPVTSFVFQPPCSGAALALEGWAVGGERVRIERFGPQVLALSYDDNRWVHCARTAASRPGDGVYAQTTRVLQAMKDALAAAGSGFEQVVRTWFYLGGITDAEGDSQRYKELNRARTDFYRNVRFRCSPPLPSIPHGIYPASTGIGMEGTDLAASCLALDSRRQDGCLLPLENPRQTPAYAYHPKYSPHSPKFSRAKALVLDDYVTTWISGTASVVQSESQHLGDIRKQTEQTIDNIEQLLSADNFAFHGVRGAHAELRDLAKIRIYLKRPEDFAPCQAICQRRFGAVPAIYAVAEVCRPELLVEIEGVAFSRRG